MVDFAVRSVEKLCDGFDELCGTSAHFYLILKLGEI